MAYAFQDDTLGLTPIAQVDSARRGPQYPGMLAHAIDPVLGGGEFMYLQGVANTVKGSLVTYNALTGQTALGVTGVHGGQPVAVAMAAIGAGQWGWYMVSGNALITKTTGAAITLGATVGVTATPGQVASATLAAAGALANAITSVAALSADTTVNAQLSRPMVN
jgi:predicted RecA/RadA family phage recombinase